MNSFPLELRIFSPFLQISPHDPQKLIHGWNLLQEFIPMYLSRCKNERLRYLKNFFLTGSSIFWRIFKSGPSKSSDKLECDLSEAIRNLNELNLSQAEAMVTLP